MRTITAWILAALALSLIAGHVGARRVETALALQCARASDGADSSIADCFTRYGLEIPEGL